MAFLEGTELFTYGGFKKVEDITGEDRLLVRNFIGDTEFTRPMKIRKLRYSGDVVSLGSKSWQLKLTPDTKIDYALRKGFMLTSEPRTCKAGEYDASQESGLYRTFKYYPKMTTVRESLTRNVEDKRVIERIQIDDWIRIAALIVARGKIIKNGKRAKVSIALDKADWRYELMYLLPFMSRLNEGVVVEAFERAPGFVTLQESSDLTRKLAATFKPVGNSVRIPNRMIYDYPLPESRKLFRYMMDPFEKKPDRGFIYSHNAGTTSDIEALAATTGNTVKVYQLTEAGREYRGVVEKEDSWLLHSYSLPFIHAVTEKSVEHYDGYVYEFDFYAGDVYARAEGALLWIYPK